MVLLKLLVDANYHCAGALRTPKNVFSPVYAPASVIEVGILIPQYVTPFACATVLVDFFTLMSRSFCVVEDRILFADDDAKPYVTDDVANT